MSFETFTVYWVEVGFLKFEIIFLKSYKIEELWRMLFLEIKDNEKLKVLKSRLKPHSSKEKCSIPNCANFQPNLCSMTHYKWHLILFFALLEEFFNILRIKWLTQVLATPNFLCIKFFHLSFNLYAFYWVLITFKFWPLKNYLRHNSSTSWNFIKKGLRVPWYLKTLSCHFVTSSGIFMIT